MLYKLFVTLYPRFEERDRRDFNLQQINGMY